jgi:pimeloyl-ACP methyl ester carboxylesterase
MKGRPRGILRPMDRKRLVMVKTFALIPGAWMGGWVWRQVSDRLREHGHNVHVVTLSGLDAPGADTSHIDLETHVNDVRSVLREADTRDIIIVGHGTSGVIAGIVADREPDRVAHVVYVEAFLPHHGKSTLDAFPEPLVEGELRAIAENQGRWPAPDSVAVAEGQGLSSDQAEWLAQGLIDHPGRPLTDPVRLTRPDERQPVTYIVCRMDHFCGRLPDDVERMRTAPGWTFRYLDTGLWPMVSAPDTLAELLAQTPVDRAARLD